jgi:hypothetical protein
MITRQASRRSPAEVVVPARGQPAAVQQAEVVLVQSWATNTAHRRPTASKAATVAMLPPPIE